MRSEIPILSGFCIVVATENLPRRFTGNNAINDNVIIQIHRFSPQRIQSKALEETNFQGFIIYTYCKTNSFLLFTIIFKHLFYFNTILTK